MGRFLAFCLLAALGAGSAHAAVAVSFVDPEHYSDARAGYGKPGVALDALRRHVVALGARYLRPDQTLAIEVLDVDLAGQVEWWRPYGYDLRVMREVTPPRIKLRYALTENGRTTAQGDETLVDPYYLWQSGRPGSTEPFYYEKTMLERWFQERFGARAAAHG
jgi:hypothetical protein